MKRAKLFLVALWCLAAAGPLFAGTPTVNGLFYMDGDYLNYPSQPYAVSEGGSKLYLTLRDNTLYLALVVDRLVNDNVFSPQSDKTLTDSAGWTSHRALARMLDSEFASFTLTLGEGAGEQSWSWQQGTAGLSGKKAKDISGANTYTNWISDETVAGGLGTPPGNIVSASSIQWNLNSYGARLNAGDAFVQQLMGSGGTAGWYSPHDSSASPVTVVNAAEGYPPVTAATNKITCSPTYEWEWALVYEWSVDMSGYGEHPVYVVTGISHHSPPKTGDQNDQFAPEDFEDPLSDFGDLPASYPTTLAGTGARHAIDVDGARLGSSLDTEVDGLPDTNAQGDDRDGADDEDGVELLSPLIPGGSAVIRVTAGVGGALSAFIDFDGDGTLDPVTFVSSTGPTALTPGVIGDLLLAGGTYELTVSVPFTAAGSMPARFRITNTAGEGGNSATGEASSGEVEDYFFFGSISDRVWNDLNGDGIQDAGEPGISEVTVRLLDSAGGELETAVTDASGLYAFTDLPGANYIVEFELPDGFSASPQDQAGDDAADSDADPVTGRAAVTLYPGQDNDSIDAGFFLPPMGAIGDRVWLDENSDGVQDAGEAGIANVRVILLDSGGSPVATNFTDSDGGYLFTGLLSGSYTVTVDTDSLAEGLRNATYDEDSGTAAPDSQTAVSLGFNEEHMTADFGYNWNPPADTDNGTGTAALGDRVWIDTNGDGAQDPDEAGFGGLEVVLYGDADGNGTYDTPLATNTTDAAGNYIFDGLAPGVYVVEVNGGTAPSGYAQTGDPDGTPDNRTTVPVILAPGDVYLNADFGYQPTGNSGRIGDRVWFDADADGAQDAGEAGIAGVTVALIQDSDGDGIWDEGEPIIATDITDAGGMYTFTGLPITDGAGTDDYLVWVNDTASVLFGLDPTFDADGLSAPAGGTVSGANISAVQDLGAAPVTDQDFGYTAAGHTAGAGLIGDTIFIDRDGSGSPDAGEGREGVSVELYDSTGTALLATTLTDENGLYSFGGLDTNRDYAVSVAAASFAAGGALEGLTNSVDPDGGFDSASLVTSFTGGVNLDQDFGYTAAVPNAIGGTLWLDPDADGTLEDGETNRFAGVTVTLSDTDGNVVATTVTGSNGDYSFSGLPDGTYIVDVTDQANVLNGHWHSDGPDDGLDNNSQDDPYTVSVSGGATDTTGDFGYYIEGASLGNRVWFETDSDGIQDAGEPGLADVTVYLQINYGSVTTTVVTVTDADGFYSFGNLLLDEDTDGAGSGEPQFILSVGNVSGFFHTLSDASGAADSEDADDPLGVLAFTWQGQNNVAQAADPTTESSIGWYDFGFTGDSTLVVISGVRSELVDGVAVISWDVEIELDTAGYWLERWADGAWVRVNSSLIEPDWFAVGPRTYAQPDPDAPLGTVQRYRIVELDNRGRLLTYGPYDLALDGGEVSFAVWASAIGWGRADSGPNADPDGDGLTSFQEYLAGTDPLSANSVLRITRVAPVSDGLQVSWSSETGRVYTVQMSTSLAEPFWPVAAGLTATPPQNTYTVPLDADAAGQAFFRVILAQ